MPSALETLVKILKLEREQGYKNTAVIGGLAAFSQKWSADAHAQARKPEHHLLVDELTTLMGTYEGMGNRSERHTAIGYMLDRITGRVPPPPQYQAPASAPSDSQATSTQAAPTPPIQPETAENLPQERRPREQRPERKGERERRPDRSRPPQRPPATSAPEQSSELSGGSDRPHSEAKPVERPAPRERQQERPQKPRAEQRPPRRPEKSSRSQEDNSGIPEDMSREFSGLNDLIDDSPYRGSRRGKPWAGELDIPPQPRLARPPRKPRPPMDMDAATDAIHALNKPVTTVRGVGPHMATLLAKLGMETVNDLLFFLPRDYFDTTKLTNISRLQPNMEITVIGTVRSVNIRVGRNNRKDLAVTIDDGSAHLTVMFFGQHFLIRQIRVGHQLMMHGKTSLFQGKIQMSSPYWEHLDPEALRTPTMVPIYPLTKGLSARVLRRLMKNTISYWSERIVDYIPEATLERADLGDLGWTIKNLHFPEGQDHLQHAKNRFIFDQLLMLQLAILAQRRNWQSVPGPALTITDDFLEPFIEAVFPYTLTNAQRRAIDDIRRDVSTTTPMNRLLQGDVGAGKTAVATVALAMAFANGKQGAIMAPTSILAEQHFRNIGNILERTPGERKPVVGLLTSALTTSEREAIYRGLADGSIDIIIGTHALIQEGVEFHDLAVAVIDEQHRFGVEQRRILRGKGTNPHLLVMTATPIPRTLALTIYADLDLSILDEKPPGRQPIQTRVVDPNARERMYSFLEAQIEKGRQAFVVHPLVEASEKIEAASAVEAYENLQQIFHRHRVGLLHGRMKPTEKDEIMGAFSAGQFDILVTTSVAEVGVDVPNATVMMIEDANRFGLAQLHQFRGRVGRGEHKSFCILVSDTTSPEAEMRLKAMEDTDDGFRLAEIDWKLRGAGDLVGTRQSGQHPMLLMADMTPELVELAQREARTLFADDPDLSKPEHRLLAERVASLSNRDSDVS